MKVRKLGTTDVMVSEIALGTMTFGTQNTEAEAHTQMAYALERGVTLWDTAELYPTNPVSAETYTHTETFIGRFFAANPAARQNVVLASKMAGIGRPHIRNATGFTPQTLPTALEGSLKRLQTDCIDLYQLHWPNRGSYHFGQNWAYTPSAVPTAELEADILATIETLSRLMQEGKIRHYGLSNETAWGTMAFIRLARANNLPVPVSIQNEYSLMYRLHDLDLAEVSAREGISLLSYSPLAMGWLSGKYANGARPANGRLCLPGFGGRQRLTPQAQEAADAYTALALAHGLNPAQMAIAFTLTRPFVASSIIGATTMEQLEININTATLTLSPTVLEGIAAIYKRFPMPY